MSISKNLRFSYLSVLLALFLTASIAIAQDGREPLGGQPPAGSKPSVKDFDYQIKLQRAFEAVNWALPAVEIYRFRAAGLADLGLKDNDILAYSKPATPKLEIITGNSSTP